MHCSAVANGAMNFVPTLTIRSRQQVYEVAGIFKGLSQGGIREEFSKNLRASLFNEDLSNEPNFGRIHLAGQYL
jgi:hypothetical protein